MHIPKILRAAILIAIGFGIFTAPSANAAAIIAQQTDGSATASIRTDCNNACTGITVGSQVFTVTASGNLGSLEVFTSGFGTMSRNPDSNDCYLRLYDQDAGVLLASSDNGFNGYGCAGDLMFTFKNSRPSLRAGKSYRWDYVFGMQNFSVITFLGSATDTVGGHFSVPPLVNAKFKAFATIAPPEFLDQFLADKATTIKQGSTTNESTVALGASLPSPLPDSLQLQIELKPSYSALTGEPNLTSVFVSSGSSTQMIFANLLNGGYHWQARSADADGNTSIWQSTNTTNDDPSFFVHDPTRGVILEDTTTAYRKSLQTGPCSADGTIIPCSLVPSFTDYTVSTPFTISKITFDWSNHGVNDCDNIGYYGAVITDAATTTSAVIATSTNSIYMGCAAPGGTGGNAEVHFDGKIVPSHFYFSLAAFDGMLQGGSDVTVSHITIYGTPAISGDQSTSTPTATPSSTSTSTQRIPLVIIPGVLGSQLTSAASGQEIWPNVNAMLFYDSDSYLDDLELTRSGQQARGMEMNPSDIIRTVTTLAPFMKQDVYQPLINSLIAAGYREGIDLFIAPYDWRLDIASSSVLIDPVIQNAIDHSPTGKIDILTHSMGGLVIKDYLSHATDTAFMNKLILVGTPQLGAPQMFKALEYGDDLGFHVGPFELLNPSEVKSIAQNMPGLYELLPSRRYVATQGGYVTDNRDGNHAPLDFDHTNEFLTASSTDSRNPTLLAQADLFHIVGDDTPVKTSAIYNIVGCQNPATDYGLVIGDDGTADIMRGSGDGTVPIDSAMNLANSYQNYFSLYSENGADHIGLVRDARPLALINAILANATATLALAPLGISTSTQDCLQGRSSFHNATTLEISTHSPIALNAYDSQNRHTGPTAPKSEHNGTDAGNTIDLQIPGSSYETVGENSFILLPASDTYRIVGDTTNAGMFTMKIKAYDDAAGLLGATNYVQIPLVSSSTTATLTVSSSTLLSPSPLLLDANGDGKIISAIAPTAVLPATAAADITPPAILMPEIPETIVVGTPLMFSYSATDTVSGIATSTATLDGVTIANGTTINNLPIGSHQFQVEAIDNAGNMRIAPIAFKIVANIPNRQSDANSNEPSNQDSNQTVFVPAPLIKKDATAASPHCRKKPTP